MRGRQLEADGRGSRRGTAEGLGGTHAGETSEGSGDVGERRRRTWRAREAGVAGAVEEGVPGVGGRHSAVEKDGLHGGIHGARSTCCRRRTRKMRGGDEGRKEKGRATGFWSG